MEMAGQDTVLPIISWLLVEIASGYRFVFIVLYQSNIFCILRSLPHRQPKTRKYWKWEILLEKDLGNP